ncbi:exported hypothetical protein [Bradyrhizobium sp. STM 3843]|uniref:hypothetical protein n=1 Tax=Bradyrhizobium sp. STM 3843 TaxID=551947 RepID=UPI00024055F9|nr:hypothetical protein [Bradyrhizobium sp. STM 3843]CCE11255.1 exported hypothetical protein [Bradyrhizobium sp. STM 3843]
MRVSLSRFGTGIVATLILALLLDSSSAYAADEANSSAGITVYSDMNYIALEGEYSGLQIALVPYYDGEKSHRKILFRSAGPFLDPPLLLDAVEEGKTLKIVVPQGNELAGAWTLTLKGNLIEAVGPGAHLKYSLKKISVR